MNTQNPTFIGNSSIVILNFCQYCAHCIKYQHDGIISWYCRGWEDYTQENGFCHKYKKSKEWDE